MRNVFGFVLILFFLFVQCSGDKKLHGHLVNMAEGLNESAPVQLDDYSTFMGASVTDDNVFQYHYRLASGINEDSVLQIIETQTKRDIREAFRSNPDLKVFTQNNISVDYIYKDAQGNVLKTIRITPKDYIN